MKRSLIITTFIFTAALRDFMLLSTVAMDTAFFYLSKFERGKKIGLSVQTNLLEILGRCEGLPPGN
jgi:hypothetical protein